MFAPSCSSSASPTILGPSPCFLLSSWEIAYLPDSHPKLKSDDRWLLMLCLLIFDSVVPGLFGPSEKLSKAGTADFTTPLAKDSAFRSLQRPWDDNLNRKGGPNLIQCLHCDGESASNWYGASQCGAQSMLITLSKGYFCTNFYIWWSCDVTRTATTHIKLPKTLQPWWRSRSPLQRWGFDQST